MRLKYTLEDEDGSTIEVTEQQFKLVQKINNRANKLERENKELEKCRDRCLVLATKWCDRSHHDWDEVLKLADQ